MDNSYSGGDDISREPLGDDVSFEELDGLFEWSILGPVAYDRAVFPVRDLLTMRAARAAFDLYRSGGEFRSQ